MSRLPPNQGVTAGWPVLHVGPVPEVDPATWTMRVHGAVGEAFELDWAAFGDLPRSELRSDFHCVTGWSRLEVQWEGVLLATLLERAEPAGSATFVRFSDGRTYDTTIPLAYAIKVDSMLADREAGNSLPPEHGGPLRAVVPGRYGWKSCKWVREVELLEVERLGFWEVRGYDNGADPWREERFV